MKFKFIFTLILLYPFIAFTQNKYVGMWKNMDDEDGKEKSHIKVYIENNEIKATVVKLLPNVPIKNCESCKGTFKNKPIEGMSLLYNMKKQDDGTYGGGTILNPKNGKEYKCTISLEDDNKIKVRGFIGFSALGKTQYWYRL